MRKAIVNIERANPPEEVTEKRAPQQPRYKKGGQVSRKMQHLGCISMCRAQEGDTRWCSAWLGRAHLQASALPAGRADHNLLITSTVLLSGQRHRGAWVA